MILTKQEKKKRIDSFKRVIKMNKVLITSLKKELTKKENSIKFAESIIKGTQKSIDKLK